MEGRVPPGKDSASHALAIATENVGERVYEEVKHASRFNLELEDVLALANKLEALGDMLGKNEFEKHFRFRDDDDGDDRAGFIPAAAAGPQSQPGGPDRRSAAAGRIGGPSLPRVYGVAKQDSAVAFRPHGPSCFLTKAYACPVYVVGPEVPPVPVREWNCQKKTYTDANLARQWAAVPIPAFAEQADGTDAEMAIYQPSSDTLWEFWQARKNNGQWEACRGGSLSNVSGSDGIFPKHYGATATSLPFLGGQITPEELQRGEIRHVLGIALGIALVDPETWSVFSWPANRSDGYNPKHAPNRIPDGLRFRLDPAVHVEALALHPIGKIIARAAQKYGFVVWDKAGAISLRAQNPKAYTLQGKPDPYPALFGQTPAYAILSGFPWERLQFLPYDYGRPKR